MFFHQRGTLGNQTAPMDEPFLTAANTSGETLRKDAHTHSNSYLGSVHTTPEKSENAALFLRLGRPSKLIRQENGAFRKRSSNRRNLKTLAFRFRVHGKKN